VAAGRSKKVRDSFRTRRGVEGTLQMAGEPLGDARGLVFIDESGFHISMTRLKARAPRGESESIWQRVPRNRGKNQTLIASITLEGGMSEALSIEGSTDAANSFL